jgi:3-deoxy-D-manno-octulosonate 8-phosphate phosphatase (KDO 8-P phosphatase)
MDAAQRAKKIKLLLMDCDGVLTDGRLFVSASGEDFKVFHVRDGQGQVSRHRAGFASGIISGRGAAEIIQRRADEVGVRFVRVRSQDKTQDVVEIADELGIDLDEIAFIGDDIGEVGAFRIVGLGIAVRDATKALKEVAHMRTKKRGGEGAVREAIEFILEAKGMPQP